MDAALQNALSAKRQIEGQIRALRERLSKIEAFISLYGEFAQGVTDSDTYESPGVKTAAEVFSAPVRDGERKPSITEAVHTILADGFPRPTAVLLNLLESRDIKVGGARPLINLSSMLSRDDRFKSLGPKRGWTLADASKQASPEPAGTGSGLFINGDPQGTSEDETVQNRLGGY